MRSSSQNRAISPGKNGPTLLPRNSEAAERGEADDGTHYYIHWLAALEKLVTGKGLADAPALYERKEAWADAYRHTPHGKPVQLRPGFRISHQYRQSPLPQCDPRRWRVQTDPHSGRASVCLQWLLLRATHKGFPPSPLDEFKRQWKARGIRRRFHLTISGCLGPCPLANVVMIQFKGHSMWFHSINSVEDVSTIYSYVEHMLVEQSHLEPPALLTGRHFQRYLVDTADLAEQHPDEQPCYAPESG